VNILFYGDLRYLYKKLLKKILKKVKKDLSV